MKIVQDQGGTIEVDSKVGKGTTFRIKLPLEKHSDETIQPTASPISP